MSEKQFRVMSNESKQLYCIESVDGEMFSMQEVVDMLNQLVDENEQLRQQLKQKQEEEKLYAREIVELNKTKNEMLNFKELGGDY